MALRSCLSQMLKILLLHNLLLNRKISAKQHDCKVRFDDSVPKQLLPRRTGVREGSIYWMYNPSIAYKYQNLYYFVCRMTWLIGCTSIENDTLAQRNCKLSNNATLMETTVHGIYDDITCTVNLEVDSIFDDLVNRRNESGWFDTKIMSLSQKSSKITNSGKTLV